VRQSFTSVITIHLKVPKGNKTPYEGEKMDKETLPQLLRVTDVCARLAMSRSVIYREIEAGNLIAIRRGSSLRISSQELSRYVESLQEVKASK